MEHKATRIDHWGWTPLDDAGDFRYCERGGRIIVMHRHRNEGYCIWQSERQIVVARDPLSLDNIIRTPCELRGYIKDGRWHDATIGKGKIHDIHAGSGTPGRPDDERPARE